VSDGTEVLPTIPIPGTPTKLSLTGNYLFIANVSSVPANQVVSVVNTTNQAVTTINLGVPIDNVSASTNSSGVVLLAKQALLQRVLVMNVDTTTYASASPIPSGSSAAANGEVNATAGLTGPINNILLTQTSSGTMYGYIVQNNGNIGVLNIVPALTSYTLANTISTGAYINQGMDSVKDSNNNDLTVYIVSSGDREVVYTTVGSNSTGAK
jgi:hypothetical protein